MIPDEYPTDTHRVSQKKKKKKEKRKIHERDDGLYVHNRFFWNALSNVSLSHWSRGGGF